MINFKNTAERDTIIATERTKGFIVSLEHNNIDGSGHLEFFSVEESAQIIKEELDAPRKAIVEVAQAEIAALVAEYPKEERETWHIQEQEAKAFMADNTVETPMLTALSLARGVTVESTVLKVLEKSSIFKAESGRIIGEQKAKLDAMGF